MQDLTGATFGKMTVIGFHDYSKGGLPRWLCRCECGQERAVVGSDMKRRPNMTCGCGRKKTLSAIRSTHRMCNSTEYHSWTGLIQRCTNPNHPRYTDYGGRGITVCERWRNSFIDFLADMGKKPTPDHSIERKNNDDGYHPDNCRWATTSEQNQNTRVVSKYTHDGKTLSVRHWAELVGMSRSALSSRLRLGWSIELALKTPVSRSNKRKSLR